MITLISFICVFASSLTCFFKKRKIFLKKQVQVPHCLFLQPENIVVEHASSQPVIKLTDFGDAVQLSPASSYIHPLLGSPEFSAPELVLGQPASLMSDIWSLGLSHNTVPYGILIGHGNVEL